MGKERAVERPPPLYHNAFRSDVAAVSAMEWFKLTVTGIIVIPLRLLLTILAVSLAYLVAALFRSVPPHQQTLDSGSPIPHSPLGF